jgi:tRNA (mo5U34)-methyltransferase
MTLFPSWLPAVKHRVRRRVKRVRALLRGESTAARLPLHGYDERLEIPLVDALSDVDLQRLNALLPWKCFVVDRHGRRFGKTASLQKRHTPQTVPDRRITLMHEYFDLSDKHVVEFGCFEGVHTVGLLQHARSVTATDGRIENVVKTVVRCTCFGYSCPAFVYDVDGFLHDERLRADVAHHVGVLYHLRDPVSHLLSLGRYLSTGLMLDTHYALPEKATQFYEVAGRQIAYQQVGESGRGDVFSGLGDHSKWLTQQTICDLLRESGFAQVQVMETREERNGPRLLLMARR